MVLLQLAGGFIIIIGIIITKLVHDLKFDKRTGTYKKRPLKELLFPPILPVHLSPPLRSKPSNMYSVHSKSLPIIDV
jgi:hypothetical protein